MDIEKLKTNEIRNRIRASLGFSTEPDKYSGNEKLNEFRSITLQIEHLIKNFNDSDSPLKWFNVEKMTEENFIELAAYLINRPKTSRNIYQQMKELKSVLDYKSLYYGNFGIIISDSLYADYRSLASLRRELENSKYISAEVYIKIRKTMGIYSYTKFLEIITNDSSKDWYANYVSYIKYLNDRYLYDLAEINPNYSYSHGLVEWTFVELYADLIINFINSSLFTGIFCYTTFSYELDTPVPLKADDVFTAILLETEKIKNDVVDLVKGTKIGQELNGSDYIIPFVFSLEREAVNKESALIRKCLLEEIQKMPDDFSFNVFYQKVRKKLFNAKICTKKYSKIFDTELNRVSEKKKKRKSIVSLLELARSNNNNYFFYTYTYKLFYREIYNIKTKSPINNESANTILKELLEYGCDWKSDRELSLLGADETDDYAVFQAKRRQRQRLRFLDAKFIRSFIVNYYNPDLYEKYCRIIQNIEESILLAYKTIDYYNVINILHYIGDRYTDRILFNNERVILDDDVDMEFEWTEN